MTNDRDERRRDRLIQKHLEGTLGEDELRRRLRAAGEGVDQRLEKDLAAYRAVWTGLAEEPPSRLTPGFARRTARAAAAACEGPSRDWLTAALLAVSFLVPAATAAAGLGLLVPATGLDAGFLLRTAEETVTRTPAVVRGVVIAGAVLFALDRVWAGRRILPSGAPP